ncbi:hypothetical protein BRAO375_3380002 [Bradyrhizobium sp. ORS 375]|nr:hypothetical protein BRAO375_3380002 [Bradyrhizobium sp. ORS 375]
MTDIGLGLDRTAAIDGGLHIIAPAKAGLAYDDGVGGVDAVDDDGHAGPLRDDDLEAFAGERGGCRPDQYRESCCTTHEFTPRLPSYQYRNACPDGLSARLNLPVRLTRAPFVRVKGLSAFAHDG